MDSIKKYSEIKSKHKIQLADDRSFAIEDLVFNRKSFRIKYVVCHEVGLIEDQPLRLKPSVLRRIRGKQKGINIERSLSEIQKQKISPSKRPYDEKFRELFKMHSPFSAGLLGFLEKLGVHTSLLRDELVIVTEIARQRFKQDPDNRSLTDLSHYRLVTPQNAKLAIKDILVDCQSLKVIAFCVHEGSIGDLVIVPVEKIKAISYIKKEIQVSDFNTAASVSLKSAVDH